MTLRYLTCPVCNERVEIEDSKSPKTVEAPCGDTFRSLGDGKARRIKSGKLTKRLNLLKKIERTVRIPEPVHDRPPQLTQAVESKLLTSDFLTQAIGEGPKENTKVGKLTLRKMSTRYKAIKEKSEFLTKFLGQIEGNKIPLNKLSEGVFTKVETKLDELIQASESYAQKHIDDPVKLDAVQQVISNAKAYKENLRTVRTDPDYDKVKEHVTLPQALEIKRRRIAFKDCEFGTFKDDDIDVSRSNERFGSGLVNTVAKLTYGEGPPRIFKKEPATDENPLDGVARLGIDTKAPHYGNRNIASYVVSDLLDTNSIAESRYTMHNGDVGLLMEMAPGKTPRQSVRRKIESEKDRRILQNAIDLKQDLAKLGYDEDPIDSGTYYRTQKAIVNPFGDKIPTAEETAQLHQELNNLEWCDMLSGQVDRHAENYLIEVKEGRVKVTGIDNDLCFGKTQGRIESKSNNDAYRGTGLPKLIDRKTYNKLIAADFDRDALPGLVGLLTTEEIDASRTRFALVQAEAKKLERTKCIVDDWKTWRSDPGGKTATAFLKESASGGGIFKRDFASFF